MIENVSERRQEKIDTVESLLQATRSDMPGSLYRDNEEVRRWANNIELAIDVLNGESDQ